MKRFNESIRDKMTPTVSTEFLYTSAMNGWLFNIDEAVKKVFDEVAQLIYSKKNESEMFRLFHSKEVKRYVEDVTRGGVQVIICKI